MKCALQGCRRAWRDATTGAMVQTVLYSVEFLQLQFLGRDVDVPVVVQRQVPGFLRTVRSAVFLDKDVVVPVVQRHVMAQTV